MGKAFSLDFRQQVIKAYNKKLVKLGREGKGNITRSINYTIKLYGIARTTLFDWLKRNKEGDLTDRNKNSGNKSKIDINEINELLRNNSNLTLNQIAEKFNVHSTTIYYLFKRNKITFKKKNYDTKKATQLK